MSSFSMQIERDGFATIEDFISERDLDDLQPKLLDHSLQRSRAGLRHAMGIPEIARIATHPRLINLVTQLLGPTPFPYRATFFDKSPNANWLVVWHQDTAVPVEKRADRAGWQSWSHKEDILYAHAPGEALSKILALRIHLDDSEENNGPLRVLPGTHQRGVFSDDEIGELVARKRPVTCCVRRGGVLAMRPLIVHASSKSQSQKPRRVLHIEYAPARVLDGFTLAVA